MRIISNSSITHNLANIGQVSFSDDDSFGVVGENEMRNIEIFAPRGINYKPCEGDNLLLIKADGKAVVGGVLNTDTHNLQAGEMHIGGSAGNYIYLKNNGDVVINGLIINKLGEIANL